MAERNTNETTRMTITVTAQVHGYLSQVVGLGIFGSSPSEAAARLVDYAFQRLHVEGLMKLPPAKGGR